ncbi:MAG TPA: hypothetical protein VJI67_03105 [archaeon]|nr:hypothetical protein [archaeon]
MNGLRGVLALLVFAALAGVAAAASECVDSDGGQNVFKKGSATSAGDNGVTLGDYCSSTLRINEAYCDSVGAVVYNTSDCPVGYYCADSECVANSTEGCVEGEWEDLGCEWECPKGACPKNSMCQRTLDSCRNYQYHCLFTPVCKESGVLECVDSDDGLDRNVKGFARGRGLELTDECEADDRVSEAYCDANNIPQYHRSFYCRENTICKKGKCIPFSLLDSECLKGEPYSVGCGVECGESGCVEGEACMKALDDCGREFLECVASSECAPKPGVVDVNSDENVVVDENAYEGPVAEPEEKQHGQEGNVPETKSQDLFSAISSFFSGLLKGLFSLLGFK